FPLEQVNFSKKCLCSTLGESPGIVSINAGREYRIGFRKVLLDLCPYSFRSCLWYIVEFRRFQWLQNKRDIPEQSHKIKIIACPQCLGLCCESRFYTFVHRNLR